MTYSREEVAFLAKTDLSSFTLELSQKSQLRDIEVLRTNFGEFARAAAELIKARQSGKFPQSWLADADSAQQATPPSVAAYRAQFLESVGAQLVHDVTCSIGTEGKAVIESGLGYLGSDLDHIRLLMAKHNLPNVGLFQADALVPSVRERSGLVVLADPARRAGGKRITDPAQLMPPLPDLLAAYAGRSLAIKCAPGLDFSSWEGLVTVTSVRGAVKEACLYSAQLSEPLVGGEQSGPVRRAVLLGDEHSLADVDVIDSSQFGPGHEPAAAEPGKYIIEPDGAIIRAGLVTHYAARENLWQLDPHIAFLSGDRIPVGRTGFEFLEQVPIKKLKQALKAHNCGRVEILVRGVDVDPDALRKKLGLKGENAMTVVIARIGNSGVAFLCGPRVSSQES